MEVFPKLPVIPIMIGFCLFKRFLAREDIYTVTINIKGEVIIVDKRCTNGIEKYKKKNDITSEDKLVEVRKINQHN